MTDQKDIESVLYLLSARSDHASVEARNLITRLRAALVDETARLEAKPVRFKVEPWEDGEVVITADGSPCGATLSRAAAWAAARAPFDFQALAHLITLIKEQSETPSTKEHK